MHKPGFTRKSLVSDAAAVKSRRRFEFIPFLILIVALAANVLPSTMTLTTVYPAPSGVYRNLITTRDAYFARDSGNVGIGTALPISKLNVMSDNAGGWERANQFVIRGRSNSNLMLNLGIHTEASPAFADIGFVEETVAWRNLVLAKNGGNVGIGTANPGAKLEVAGNIIASDPTAGSHVATMQWVQKYVSALSGGGIVTFRYVGGLTACPVLSGTTLRAALFTNSGAMFGTTVVVVASDCIVASTMYGCLCLYGAN